MLHRIVDVKPMEKTILSVVFQNGVEKTYDVQTLYHVFPQFKVLEVDFELFRNVKVDAGGYGISWNDDLDLAAEDIWLDGIETGKRRELEIALVFAEKLLQAREESGLTQKQLAERTGIYQGDISKLERGQGNPSLSTITRLAEAMDLRVRIEFERRK